MTAVRSTRGLAAGRPGTPHNRTQRDAVKTLCGICQTRRARPGAPRPGPGRGVHRVPCLARGFPTHHTSLNNLPIPALRSNAAPRRHHPASPRPPISAPAMTDDASQSALRSTRNRPRTAVHRRCSRCGRGRPGRWRRRSCHSPRRAPLARDLPEAALRATSSRLATRFSAASLTCAVE
jgi:hypothetical protein